MTNAYKCDGCGSYGDGEPVISQELSVSSGDMPKGILSQIFSNGDASKTADFCSLECFTEYDVTADRDALVADVDNKQEVLDAPNVDVLEESDDAE